MAYSRGFRGRRFGDPNLNTPNMTPPAEQGQPQFTPGGRARAILSRMRQGAPGMEQQPAPLPPVGQHGSFVRPGSLRARFMERFNSMPNPNPFAPPTDQGPV